MTADEMGEASFPASDLPAVWTWDVEPAPDPEMGTDTRLRAPGGSIQRSEDPGVS
jgi:hypothetical protein